jgi:hypothetical protein
LAQAFAALGQIPEAARQYELAAVAEGADRASIASSYKKLMGHALPGVPGPVARTKDRAPSPTEALDGLRIGHFPWTGAQPSVAAVLATSPAGIEAVHAQVPDGDAQASLPALRQLKWSIVFPDAAPRLVFLIRVLSGMVGRR